MDEEEVKGEIRIQEEDGELSEDVAVLEIVNYIQKGLSTAVGSLCREQPPTIYRVPKVLRQANEKCYVPLLFSIGPYHHGKEELKPMEEVKFKHLQALLARNPKLELKDYVREIRALEEQARGCYSESIRMGSNEFVGMMVVDGCFLVEMFMRMFIKKSQYELWVPYFISHDMLLLENQLPFFILNRIFCLVDVKAFSIKKLVRYCFRIVPLMPLNDRAHPEGSKSYHHLLDWFHHHCLPHPTSRLSSVEDDSSVFSSAKRCFLALARVPGRGISSLNALPGVLRRGISSLKALPGVLRRGISSVEVQPPLNPDRVPRLPPKRGRARRRTLASGLSTISSIIFPNNPSADQPTTLYSIRSAEELQEAGIVFKRKEEVAGRSFLDIKFQRNGVIEIPYLYFSDNLHSIFQNLIAYEQCYPEARTFFTGYASFMDDIINTAKDVQILRHSGILEHGLGSDEELAGLFNQMNKGVFTDPEETHLREERMAISVFCATRWRKWRANLMRNYFYSPWAILSLAAALLLLLLTITQTVFSIYPNV